MVIEIHQILFGQRVVDGKGGARSDAVTHYTVNQERKLQVLHTIDLQQRINIHAHGKPDGIRGLRIIIEHHDAGGIFRFRLIANHRGGISRDLVQKIIEKVVIAGGEEGHPNE